MNGAGGVVGAEVAQRVLMPVVGMHGALGVFGLGYAALAGVLIHREEGWSGWAGPTWRPVGVALLIIGLGYGWLLRLPLIHPAPTAEIKFTTVDLAAGPEGVVAVTESDRFGRGIVMFNQYVLGSTAGLASERRQGHLPIVLHPAPRSVAFIGLATGITAGAALMHDVVESVTPIELSRLVAAACREHFAEYTNDLFNDRRANVVVEDGRAYIAACVDRFDVVVGDLFLPWRPGVGRLYSVEHFRAVRRSLRDGGLFCQMLPMYQFGRRQQEVVLATFLTVFPEAHLFRVGFNSNNPILAIVGFRGGGLDWGVIERRCRQVRDGGRITDPLVRRGEAVAMMYLGRVSADDGSGGLVNTLSNAWIELSAGEDFVTGAWVDDYFLNGERWLAFEERRVGRVAGGTGGGPDVGIDLERMTALGSMISRWDYAVSIGDTVAASALASKLRDEIPESLQTDAAADPSTWQGWRAILRRSPGGG